MSVTQFATVETMSRAFCFELERGAATTFAFSPESLAFFLITLIVLFIELMHPP